MATVVLAFLPALAGAASLRVRGGVVDMDRPPLPPGTLWGSFASGGWQGPLSFESALGRTLGVQRVYYKWNDAFPSAADYLARDLGRTLILSWSPTAPGGGAAAKWADIANGAYDALIDARARDLTAFQAPLFFVFHQEPGGAPFGTPQEFQAAFRHIEDRFTEKGVINAYYTVVLVGSSYENGKVDQYYPGDDYVDFVGADLFNFYTCRQPPASWQNFQRKATALHDFGLAHGKPMVVAEWASVEDPLVPNRKAQWISDASATLKAWPEVKAVAYLNSGTPAVNCDWWVTTSGSAFTAFQEMGADPFFGPPPVPSVTDVTGYVDVLDNKYGVLAGYPAQGKAVQWLFKGPSTHSVTDASGMDYFDSGARSPGQAYSFAFVGAAGYPYRCTVKPTMTARVLVPMAIEPTAGSLATPFIVTWSSAPLPAGLSFDEQVKRPGSSTWANWKSATTATSGIFLPDGGPGTYSFRSRVRGQVPGALSQWSPVATITVSP